MMIVNRHQKQAALKPNSLWLTPKAQPASIRTEPKPQLSIRELALARLEAQKATKAA